MAAGRKNILCEMVEKSVLYSCFDNLSNVTGGKSDGKRHVQWAKTKIMFRGVVVVL